MDKYRNYNINFSGLKNGKHEFEFQLYQEFFDLFETEKEFTNANLVCEVLLEKHTTFLDFVISVSGKVNLICDISNEEFIYPLENETKVLVKFGEEYNDDHEEIITIPHHYSDFNIAQIVYEMVMLAIPMKKLAPNIDENEEYQVLLEKFSPKQDEEKSEDEAIDPRWAMLNKLKK
ncbi:MAG: DUF177 domain-containing protein [Flavobacteriaceae bacterium]|nr:DUF177 domain-containing protein [Flavobacteriaceae bacterium]